MKATFVAGFGPIVRDPSACRGWWQAMTGVESFTPWMHGAEGSVAEAE